MALQYVKDEAGTLNTDEATGNPLVFDDVKDPEKKNPFPLDGISLYTKIPFLNEEAKTHRLKAKEFETKFEAYKDIDPVKAREAIEKLEGLKAGDLTKAEDVEKLKKDISVAYESQMVEVKKGYEQKLTDAAEELTQKDAKVYKLLISNMFANSEYCTGGDKSKSVLSAGMLQAFLGSHFKEEDGKIVGYDFHNNLVMSRERPGEPANEKEALDFIIENHPEKDKILRASPGGSGAHGNAGEAGKATISRAVFEGMDAIAKKAYASRCSKGEAHIKD